MLYSKRPKGQINLQLGLPIITYVALINLVHARGRTQNIQQYTLFNLIENNPPNLEDVRFSPTSIHPNNLVKAALHCSAIKPHGIHRSSLIQFITTQQKC